MKLLAITLAAVLTGCASSSAQYYEAVQKAAEANAAAARAKFEALSTIAASGDGQAASAAVMALALTQTPTVQPVPQKSEALQWASILAAPISNLGMMWLQTDSSKALAEYNRDVSLARISADSVNQQALYGAFTETNAVTAGVATAGFDALGSVDYTPWINGLVDLGTAGIDGAVDVSTTGFGSIVTLQQSNNDFAESVVNQYTATVNAFIDNPLVNTTTTNTQTTLACSVDANGALVCQ